MASLNMLGNIAEVCDKFAYESNLLSLDSNEISCLSCRYWDGKGCTIREFEKVMASIE